MATPLKALLQERLRAKIVRQGDEDDSLSTNTEGGLTLSNTTPSIDPSKYTSSPTRNYATPHSCSHPSSNAMAFDDYFESFSSDREFFHRSARSRRDQEPGDDSRSRYDLPRHSHRPVSPVTTYSGNKRLRREEQTLSEPMHYHKRPTRDSDRRSGLDPLPTSPQPPVMPRKNYDLSRAYQRYRELSRQGRQTRTPQLAPRDHDREIEIYRSGSAGLFEPSDVGVYKRPSSHDSVRTAPKERTTSWDRPTRSSFRENRHVNTDTIKPKASSYYDRREVYPTHRALPTYRHSVVSPTETTTKRRMVSPRIPNHCFDPYNGEQERENRMVFTAARLGSIPRSPRRPQFLRHDDFVHDPLPTRSIDTHRLDIGLSPESHQAAKDFVEKRQKRTTQGTPRTMATYRWLESMADTRQENGDATPARDLSFENSNTLETPTRRSYDISAIVKPSHYHYASTDDQEAVEATLSPVYTPPRYPSTQKFFSSAV